MKTSHSIYLCGRASEPEALGSPGTNRETVSNRGKRREPEGRLMPILPGLTGTFSTILSDPPWRFDNRTGKLAPEHRRLRRCVFRMLLATM